MSKPIQEKMHAQHRRWQSDQSAWREDIEEWRKELREAIAALADLDEMFRSSRDALESHAAAVWEEEQRLHAHELALYREIVDGERKKTDKQWAAIHARQAGGHDRLADAHARIEKHHHAVIAAVRRLLQRARGAM